MILTKQDAAAALGETVQEPESKSGLPIGPGITVSTCGYTGSGVHSIQLDLFVIGRGEKRVGAAAMTSGVIR
jgi:hypothetical protein